MKNTKPSTTSTILTVLAILGWAVFTFQFTTKYLVYKFSDLVTGITNISVRESTPAMLLAMFLTILAYFLMTFLPAGIMFIYADIVTRDKKLSLGSAVIQTIRRSLGGLVGTVAFFTVWFIGGILFYSGVAGLIAFVLMAGSFVIYPIFLITQELKLRKKRTNANQAELTIPDAARPTS
ncbi:hypothetical protein [Pelagicoccus sp. SDUM812002]|uniref:hypothetical protein n=1 Tax=Pelagicoccus sp. SDUM812002 TaxID=3041266 RepID=UPI00280FF5B8|nr:hypothetical protein [Pelagicoccus sp. SDUM812002]MDQ8188567.1 hypothetical protein [Pelagicoccus sp. SDUM812002]